MSPVLLRQFRYALILSLFSGAVAVGRRHLPHHHQALRQLSHEAEPVNSNTSWLSGLRRVLTPKSNLSQIFGTAQLDLAWSKQLSQFMRTNRTDPVAEVGEMNTIGEAMTNNLGDEGPDEDEPEPLLVWADVLRFNGVPIDLVVQNVSEYTPYSTADNGNLGQFGIINVKAGTHVDLKFTLWNRKTGRPQKVNDFVIGILDLDINSFTLKDKEAVIGSGFSYVLVHDDTTVAVSTLPDGRTVFAATHPGTTDDNPSSLSELNDMQLKTSIGLIYYGVSSWTLTFSVGEGKRGRNFLFAGSTGLSQLQSPKLPEAVVNADVPPELLNSLAASQTIASVPAIPPQSNVLDASDAAARAIQQAGGSADQMKASQDAAKVAAAEGVPQDVAVQSGALAAKVVASGVSPDAAKAIGPAVARGLAAGNSAEAALAAGESAASEAEKAGITASDSAKAAGMTDEAAQAARKAAMASVIGGQTGGPEIMAGAAAAEVAQEGLGPEAAAEAGKVASQAAHEGASIACSVAAGVAAGKSMAADNSAQVTAEAVKASLAACDGSATPEAAAANAASAISKAELKEEASLGAGETAAAAALAAGADTKAAESAKQAATQAGRDGHSAEAAAVAGVAAREATQQGLPAPVAGSAAADARDSGMPEADSVAAGLSAATQSVPPCDANMLAPSNSASTMTIGGRSVYQCATEGSTCNCRGHVTFGHTDAWTEFQEVESSVTCSESVFGDPDPSSRDKVCMCRAWLPVTRKIWFPAYLVAAVFLLVHIALACMRRRSFDGTRWQKTLEATLPALPFGPMLIAVMLVVAERGEQLGGYPIVVSMLQGLSSLHDVKWDLSNIFHALPRGTTRFVGVESMVIGLNVLAWSYLLQVCCRIIAKYHVFPYPDRMHMPRCRARSMAQFWFNLWNVFYTVMVVDALFLLWGVFMVMSDTTKATKHIPMSAAPNAATKDCICLLVVVYFVVHITSHVLTFALSNNPVSIAMMRRLAINMEILPMVATIFLAAQLVADAAPMELPAKTAMAMYFCTLLFMGQVVLSMAQPLFFNYRLEVLGTWDMEKSGEADIIIQPGPGLFLYNSIRWAALFGGYITAMQVAWSLYNLNKKLKTPFAKTHLTCLGVLAGIYFVTEVIRLAIAIRRHLLRGTSWSVALPNLGVVYQLFMECCPMLAMMVVAHWCEVSFK
eukprot:CAMPEP_0170611306 /NCGR_PEP_ID=MMETSP0224-20130122/23119_1 /TAXON_ID=285029 /ORGANISM="Togula jolla, Strain CCCM 725" /LENGTH=1183 /DNA_ID=CAMNT_0010936733 /DNA_START=15 /DNA_END=3566 /DNA_ORIENTATION=+